MKYLYFSPIPETSQPTEQTTTGKTLSTLAAEDLSSSVVEATGSQAADVTLDGQYRYGAKYATKFARELDELADSAFTNLPLFGGADGDDLSRPGYYAIESATIEPLHPNSREVWTYDLSLTLEGTQATHRQAVKTSRDQRKNDFGESDQDVHIATPANASIVEWWDGTAETEVPTPIETRTTAYGDVAVYDVDAAGVGGDSPTLLYRSPGYEAERDLHCRLWDDYGRDSKREGGDGPVQWVRAFATDHEPRGKLVLSNGLLRVTLDDRGETLAAERWSSGSWTAEDLTGGWAPIDVDVRTISPARIEARILFSDGSDRYPLDMILSRGAEDALFARTPNASSATPSTLVDYLSPIASTTIYDVGAEQALVKREEVSQ